MEILKKNNLIKKIAIIILFIMCFNILIPSGNVTAKSWAGETADANTNYTPGGSLFQPIMDFLVFLADSILNVLQHNFITIHDVVYSPTSESNGTFSWGWLGVALIAVVAIAYGVACIYTGGAALGAAGAVSTILTGCLWSVGGGLAAIHAFGELSDLAAGQFDVPFIMYNPYSIFSGDIPALDINFINPREPVFRSQDLSSVEEIYVQILEENEGENVEKLYNALSTTEGITPETIEIGSFSSILDLKEKVKNLIKNDSFDSYPTITFNGYRVCVDDRLYDGTYIVGWVYDTREVYVLWYDSDFHGNGAEYSYTGELYTISTEQMLDFLNIEDTSKYVTNIRQEIDDNTHYYQSSAAILQSSIATWYKVLRRVALVGLLSVLVYVGIRIILSAAAADKAKYKKMFIDWIVAVCMLFVLHYIMILILTLSTNLTEIVNEEGALNMVFELPADSTISTTEGTKNLSDMAIKMEEEGKVSEEINQYSNITVKTENGKTSPLWNGEFMGYIRLKAGSVWVRNQMAYGLMYLVLVIYVCTFTFMYLRRVLYMAFLTMIAPLIALTYPLDKIKDGQAQAFGLWLREYIFNALIQPVHLIIYTMVISMVINLAVDHPVYAIVALGFMLPAEKFIRNMFGFQKASTIDKAGGVLGGAALMTAVSKLASLGKKKDDKKEDKGKDGVRTADKNTPGVDLPDVDIKPGNDGDSGNIRMNNNSYESGDSSNSTTNSTSGNVYYTNNLADNDASSTYSGYSFDENGGYADLSKQQNSVSNEQKNNAQSAKTQENKKQSSKPKIPIKNRLKNATASVANRGKNRILKARPLRTVGKFTAMAAGAATLGMVGLAAGISTGEFGNVLKFTGTGIGVGGALGKNIGERTIDKASEIKEDFKEGYKGSEEYNNEKLDREYFNGQGFQEMLDNSSLMPNLSGGERAGALRQEIENYRASGLTDNKQIASCMKAGLSSEEGVCALQISNLLKGMNLDSEGKDAYKKAYEKKLGSQFDSSTIDSIWKVIEANM